MNIKSIVSIVVLLFVTGGVFAHTNLASSYPQKGAMMVEQPENMELVFHESVRLISVKMKGSEGNAVDLAFQPSPEAQSNFSIKMPMLQPDTYTVRWITMGADGHKVKGKFKFTQK